MFSGAKHAFILDREDKKEIEDGDRILWINSQLSLSYTGGLGGKDVTD